MISKAKIGTKIAKTNAKAIATNIKTLPEVATIYQGLQYYKPYRDYNGNKTRHILRKLGSSARLPKLGYERLVLESAKGVKVWIVNSGKGYYFYERFSNLMRNNSRMIH
jgi:hypothetical protein